LETSLPLTSNQIIAAVTALVILLLLFVVSWPAETQAKNEGTADISLRDRALPSLVRGVIITQDLVYFASLIIVSCSSITAPSGSDGSDAVTSRAPILGIAGLIFRLGLISHGSRTIRPRASSRSDGMRYCTWRPARLPRLVLLSGSGSVTQFVRARSTRYGANAIVYTAFSSPSSAC
jgi:hypothetical protein